MQPRKPGRSSPTTRDWRPTLELRTIWKSCVARCAELTNFWASKILNWCRLEQRFFLAWNLTKQTTTERKQNESNRRNQDEYRDQSDIRRRLRRVLPEAHHANQKRQGRRPHRISRDA